MVMNNNGITINPNRYNELTPAQQATIDKLINTIASHAGMGKQQIVRPSGEECLPCMLSQVDCLLEAIYAPNK